MIKVLIGIVVALLVVIFFLVVRLLKGPDVRQVQVTGDNSTSIQSGGDVTFTRKRPSEIE